MRNAQEIEEELVRLEERLTANPHEGLVIRACMQGIMWASGRRFTVAPSHLFASDLTPVEDPNGDR